MSLETEVSKNWVQRILKATMGRLTDQVLKEKKGEREGEAGREDLKEGREGGKKNLSLLGRELADVFLSH